MACDGKGRFPIAVRTRRIAAKPSFARPYRLKSLPTIAGLTAGAFRMDPRPAKQFPKVSADRSSLAMPDSGTITKTHESQVTFTHFLDHPVPVCPGAYGRVSYVPTRRAASPRSYGGDAAGAFRLRQCDSPLDGLIHGIRPGSCGERFLRRDSRVEVEYGRRGRNTIGAYDRMAALRNSNCRRRSQLAVLRPCPGWILAAIFSGPRLECAKAQGRRRDSWLRAFELTLRVEQLATGQTIGTRCDSCVRTERPKTRLSQHVPPAEPTVSSE